MVKVAEITDAWVDGGKVVYEFEGEVSGKAEFHGTLTDGTILSSDTLEQLADSMVGKPVKDPDGELHRISGINFPDTISVGTPIGDEQDEECS